MGEETEGTEGRGLMPAGTTTLPLEQDSERLQRYVSPDLHHFVGRHALGAPREAYELLIRIVKEGVLKSPVFPDAAKGSVTVHISDKPEASLATNSVVLSECVCFCDIPRDDLGIHTSKYGSFGLSFKKSVLIQKNVRPVQYVPVAKESWRSPLQGLTLLKDIQAVCRGLADFETDHSSRHLGMIPHTAEDAISAASDILCLTIMPFLKAYNPDLPDNDPDNYYMEREWRVLHQVEFAPEDLSGVFLPRDYVSRFQTDFPDFPGAIVELPPTNQ